MRQPPNHPNSALCTKKVCLTPSVPKSDQHSAGNTLCFINQKGDENEAHEKNSLDILTNSPHYFLKKCLGTRKEYLHFDHGF